MDNQNPQPTNPVQESSVNPASNNPQTPSPTPNPQRKRFMFILIGFFILFLITLGSAAAIYTFKEVSRSDNRKLQPVPSTTLQPSTEFEASPLPTSTSSSTECVVAGCSGQLCVNKGQDEGMVTTCEYTESYACYKTATCELQESGKCGWTKTPELTSCLNSAL